MNIKHGEREYEISFIENREDGYAGLELKEVSHEGKHMVAKLVYWDANGQFSLETVNADTPLTVIERLIAEAKAKIKVC